MATHEQITTYWLCPAEADYAYFAQLIRDLAGRFDAPIFQPHVTLYVTSRQKENPQAVLDKVLPAHRPVRLKVSGLDHSEEFTKTLFVQLGDREQLVRLSEDLRRASVVQNDYQLNPHLSLLYKTMDEKTRRELANSIRIDVTEIRFDSVKAVISPAEIRERSDVEAWQVVDERKLIQ